MSKTFYLTGDRSMDPINSAVFVGKAVTQILFENEGQAVTFLTGNAPSGIEAAVRFIVPPSRLTVLERGKTEEGYIDFDATHKKIADLVDSAVVLHGDPLGSRIGQSVVANFPDEKVRFLAQEEPAK